VKRFEASLKRKWAVAACWLFVFAISLCQISRGAAGKQEKSAHWVGTWASSPQLADAPSLPPAPGFADATLRQVVHVSIGGPQIRVRFSNAFGTTPLTIFAAHVAKAGKAGSIQVDTDRDLAFQGRLSVTIPPGALLYSDPIDFDLRPLSDLAVTIRLKGAPDSVTMHAGSRATSYLVQGDAVTAADLSSAQTVDHWYFLNGVDAAGRDLAASVVVLGDSITNGRNATANENRRWTDALARRLCANRRTEHVGVLNEGIGGNRLRHDGLGPNALARLDRDVLSQTGAHWLIVFEGVNDIGTCKKDCNLDSTSQDIVGAYEQIIVRAHSQGMRVYGATITPFGGSFYSSPEAEHVRQTVNNWIRTSGRFDAVIDFDAVTRDPQNHSNLSAVVDGGDHLHPADAGYTVMGDAISLKLFEH
jgi:lysophospholipase L1-like esterase